MILKKMRIEDVNLYKKILSSKDTLVDPETYQHAKLLERICQANVLLLPILDEFFQDEEMENGATPNKVPTTYLLKVKPND